MLRQTGISSLEALVDADIVVGVLKLVTRRERPQSGDHGGHFETGGASFPSGHSAQAWALASLPRNIATLSGFRGLRIPTQRV